MTGAPFTSIVASGVDATSFSFPLASERTLSVYSVLAHVVRKVRETMLLFRTKPPGISTKLERTLQRVTSQSEELSLLKEVQA